MPERFSFAPTDFNTDFMDDPSAAEDRVNRRISLAPTTWIHNLLGTKDWAPSWIKEGYNRSLEGLAYEWMHGEPFFDESKIHNQGFVNDLMSTVMSFATVGDVLTLGAGSMMGKAAMSKLMASTGNKAIKAGMSKKTAQIGTQHGAEQFFAMQNKMGLGKTIAAHSGVSGIGLGFYEGLHSATAQLADKNDLDFLETLKGATRGFVTGGAIGASGAYFAGAPVMKKLPGLKSMKATGGFASRSTVGEVGAVGALPAIESTIAGDPRLPNAEDYLYAAGMIGGLKAQHKIGSGIVKGLNKASGREDYIKAADKFTPEQVAKEKRKIVETELKSGKKLEYATEEWSNKDNSRQTKITDPNWRETTKNGVDYTGKSKSALLKLAHALQNKMGISKEKGKKIKKDLFGKDSMAKMNETQIADYMNHLKKNWIEVEHLKSFENKINGKKTGETIQKGTKESMPAHKFFGEYTRQPEGKWISKDASVNRKREVRGLSKSLGESSKDYRNTLEKFGIKKLSEADGTKLVKIKDHYKDRLIVESFVKNKSNDKSIRMHMVNMAPEGVVKSSLSSTAYGVFRKNIGSLKKAVGGSEYARLGVQKINNADFKHTYWNARLAQAYESAGLSKLTPEQAINLNYVMTELGGQNFSRELAGTGRNRKQGTRTVTDPKGKKKKIYNVKGRDGKYLELDIGQASPRNIKKLMDYMYESLKRSGIPVKEYLPNYMPQLFKLDKLNKILDEVSKLHEDYSSVFGNEMLAKNPPSKKQINEHLKQLARKADKDGGGAISETGREIAPEFIRFIRGYAKTGQQQGIPNSFYNAWNIASQNIFAEKTLTAPHVEKSRRLEIPKELKAEFLEQDARKLLLRYTDQFSKRLAFSQEFGVKGERMNALVDKLKSKPQEQEALNRAYHSFTGMIEFNPNFNYTKTWKNFYQQATNFMVATKIGLGFASIPNLTQSMISTAVKHGYTPMIKGIARMYFDKPFQRRLLKSVGQTNNDMMKSMFGLDMTDAGLLSKFAEKTTQLGFNQINSFNYKLAAATQYEALLAHQRHALGKGLGRNRLAKERALKELRKYGFSAKENLNVYGKGKGVASSQTKTKIMKAMHEFARDSQLQRNVLNDPYFASNPKHRPFVLFKRFGVRQASWMTEMLSQEMFRYKNPLPALRLAAGGAAGGLFVMSAKEFITDFLSNEDIFNENYTIQKMLEDGSTENVTMRDIAESLGAVGSLGWITDIITAEDKLNAVEFLATPALAMDGMRVWDTLSTVIVDSKEFGIDMALRRSAKKAIPLFGTVPKQILTRRVETNRQKIDFYTRRKTFVKNDMLDAILNGNSRKAIRLIKEWNNTIASSDVWKSSPGLIMDYEDISPDAVVGRYINKILKAKDIPQQFRKYII